MREAPSLRYRDCLPNSSGELIECLETDRSLLEPSRVRARIEALEQIDRYFPPFSFEECDSAGEAAPLRARATAIVAELERLNQAVYDTIRRDIRQGDGADSLRRWAGTYETEHVSDSDGYDYLDEIMAGVLRFGEPDPTSAETTPEMVFYQPTPARHIFDLIARTALTENDVFIDLGSGLGHVVMLVSICTPARGIGIEVEPAYVACARQSATALELERVTFLQEDVLATDLSYGTVFYLYTPFSGGMLRTALDLLRAQAARRELRICSYGPCSETIAAEDWLAPSGAVQSNRISIFRSNLLPR